MFKSIKRQIVRFILINFALNSVVMNPFVFAADPKNTNSDISVKDWLEAIVKGPIYIVSKKLAPKVETDALFMKKQFIIASMALNKEIENKEKLISYESKKSVKELIKILDDMNILFKDYMNNSESKTKRDRLEKVITQIKNNQGEHLSLVEEINNQADNILKGNQFYENLFKLHKLNDKEVLENSMDNFLYEFANNELNKNNKSVEQNKIEKNRIVNTLQREIQELIKKYEGGKSHSQSTHIQERIEKNRVHED